MPPKKKLKLTRNKAEVFLVKKVRENLSCYKLPTGIEVLQYYLYLRNLNPKVKKTVLIRCHFKINSFELRCPPQADCCVMSKLVRPWNLAGFPIITLENIRKKIDKMVNNYYKLKKNSKRNSPTDTKRNEAFFEEMLKCFWISKKKEELIEDIIKDRRRTSEAKNEDIVFILDQIGNRIGRIGTNDKRFTYTIKRSHKKLCSMLNMEIKVNNGNNLYSLENSSSSDNNSDCEYVADVKKEQSTSVVLLPKNILKKTALTAIGEGLSVRQHTAIVASVIANSGGDVTNFAISSSTEFRVAKEVVTKEGEKIKKHVTDLVKSSSLPIILHFDGKIVKEFTSGIEHQLDRLAVSIRIDGQSELLGVPHLSSSTGETQKNTIIKLLHQFDIFDKLQGCVFDTTSVNTGNKKDVCIRLAAELDRPLLLLACRHHIYERHIIHCWNIYPSSKINGPDNPLFKKLKDLAAGTVQRSLIFFSKILSE
ncbi:uncharacterized protein LOC136093333 [Hydra vulgaris]|uniref:uncharacterized protein LOC136093333 n=1 Tax=Hydra vulgaris TaxID=6087 RepID=UPI0032EA6B52